MLSVEEWRSRGRTVPVPDGRVWAVEVAARGDGSRSADGAKTGVPVLVMHGFPTASWDFAPLVELLSVRRRVVCFDFLGHGLSDKPRDYGYSLFEQADVAIAVARAMGLGRVHLLAHDMGTSVATELLARRERDLLPFEVASFVLMNGSVHIELAHPTIGQRLLRSPLGPFFAKLNSRATFKAQMKRVFARPPGESELDAMWSLVSREDGTARMPAIIRYMEERARFHGRWIGALKRCDCPALVAWGRRDPVAVFAIAETLAREIPGAKLETWDDLGHYPQVEDPARVARTLESFWDGLS